MTPPLAALEQPSFPSRHLGPDPRDEADMLSVIGAASRRALVEALLPRDIARAEPMQLPAPLDEPQALAELKAIAARNRVLKSFIGQGYHGTHTPGVILRNVLENPAWYTAYTPYQAEISQGRLEALLNFQTLVADLTGLPVANASMLDEATAAAEAMTLARRVAKARSDVMVVSGDVHPQTLAVLQSRAAPLGLVLRVAESAAAWQAALAEDHFAAFVQYPASSGWLHDWRADAQQVHARQALFIVAADPLALTLLVPPGEFGADIAVGSTQRFGMPMGAGGPHAAYLACRDDFKRSMPGRLVGVSVDSAGHPALRLALQTREQHIRREKATSNICTAQVLPAVVASLYAVYHGPAGLQRIAQRVATYTAILSKGLQQLGWDGALMHHPDRGTFDTVCLRTDGRTEALMARAVAHGMNLRRAWDDYLCISLDETTTRDDLLALWRVFAADGATLPDIDALARDTGPMIPATLQRKSPFLTHPVFNRHHSETAMLRYLRRIADRDLALDRTMIPLGSCTMKLNATAEMIPITWPEFAQVHPFAPADQLQGYAHLNEQLTRWLGQATGYAGISLQPNAGSQGEYAGLLVIRAWHAARGEAHRTVCLIPESAHGTNPASAQMAGLQVVVVKCDGNGSVDLDDLRAKCALHAERLACIMITYPSTYGVFEPQVKALCEIVRSHGGRVYIDGANLNALVGLAAPGQFGGDVSHLNLHKTFCIPHGGGGPGVGPVCVVDDLVPFLPAHPAQPGGSVHAIGAISAAPLGNASVLPISWMYLRLMGAQGLQAATEMAILNANYIAARLAPHYDIHFSSGRRDIAGGGVAHECILDLRPLKELTGITAEDVAKRLIDYGFHAPTLSFPVPGTLMVEPTESESKAELDRFCDAMIAIRGEIDRVARGEWPREDNPLRQAPHTAAALLGAEWSHAYPRETAAYPLASLRQDKYWPPVGRVDNVHGDRHLFCSCPPLTDYA